ncbi:MAG: hypothetical protein HGA36_00910 [Candidatus Moranbacteria bacterium]|nr:hypothetical protein [Candidatus Moranbacteria bacterium]
MEKESNEKTIIKITEEMFQDRAETMLDRQLTNEEMEEFRNGSFWDFEEARDHVFLAIDAAIEELIN